MDRFEKIKEARQRMDAKALKETNEKLAMVQMYADKIRSRKDEYAELVTLADELQKNGLPIGKEERTICGTYRDSLISEGCDHKVGFVRMGRTFGLGIIGGGCCGNDLTISADGEIVKNPLHMVVGTWTADNAYHDYVGKCRKFVGYFDAFKKEFFDYIDNL